MADYVWQLCYYKNSTLVVNLADGDINWVATWGSKNPSPQESFNKGDSFYLSAHDIDSTNNVVTGGSFSFSAAAGSSNPSPIVLVGGPNVQPGSSGMISDFSICPLSAAVADGNVVQQDAPNLGGVLSINIGLTSGSIQSFPWPRFYIGAQSVDGTYYSNGGYAAGTFILAISLNLKTPTGSTFTTNTVQVPLIVNQ